MGEETIRVVGWIVLCFGFGMGGADYFDRDYSIFPQLPRGVRSKPLFITRAQRLGGQIRGRKY